MLARPPLRAAETPLVTESRALSKSASSSGTRRCGSNWNGCAAQLNAASASASGVPRGTSSTTPTSYELHERKRTPCRLVTLGAPHALSDMLCEPTYVKPYRAARVSSAATNCRVSSFEW